MTFWDDKTYEERDELRGEIYENYDFETLVKEFILIEEQNKTMREVVEFYAKDKEFEKVFKLHPNFGNMAREALVQIKEMTL